MQDSRSNQKTGVKLRGTTVFGDLSYAYSKSTPLQLKTLNERFVLDGYIGLLMGKRADFQMERCYHFGQPV
jgi:hypothetical protein